MHALLGPPVFQLPLAQNYQYPIMTHLEESFPEPLHLTCFHSVCHPHLILRIEDKPRENFNLAVKYCYVLNFLFLKCIFNVKFLVQV